MAIADDLVGHAHVAYLGDPFEQYCGLNGKPLIGGWIEVYRSGTDTRYITMQNFDGAMNPFKVPLNADGRVVMLADPSLTYDVYVRNSYGDLVCSRLNVECTCPGNISINGLDTWVRNTDGTLNVSLQTSANNRRVFTVNSNSKLLDVQDPLYFVENSNTATVIGFSGDSSSDISGKMDESKLEYSEYGEISAYNGSAFAGGQGGAGDPEVNALVHSNSATWNDVSAKLDTTAFSTVSGNFLTAHQDLSQYTTHDDLTAYQTVEGMTAYQPKGDYADATALDGKVDTSSFTAFSSTTNENIEYISGALSGTYELSAGSGIDITDYPNEQKTVISVTAQGGNPEVENLVVANSATWNDVTAKLDTTSFSTVSGSFLTAVPDTYLQNTDLTVVDNKVTEISGVELSAGTSLEFEYDSADNISAINNSAISTTPSQALYAKSPLYFDVTGTSSYMGINIDTLKRALGIDETVLADNISVSATGFTLSEKASNFETIKIYGNYGNFTMLQGRDDRLSWTCDFNSTVSNNRLNRCYTVSSTDGIHWNEINVYGYDQTAFNGNLNLNGGTDWWLETQKIVGIGRKEV